MSQLSYMTPGVVGFTDRRTRLLVVGIVILVAGIICLLLSLTIPAVMLIPRPPGMPTPKALDLIPGMLLYITIGGLAIALSIGLIRARRWVRPVILCMSTIWLIVGVGAVAIFCVMMPRMLEMMKTAGGSGRTVMPNGVAIAVVSGSAVFSLLLYIVTPILLMLSVRSSDVQSTLEFFDPEPRWTDGVPLIVLGLSMACMLGAVGALFAMPRGMFMLFGLTIFGWPGRIALGVMIAALLVMSRLILRRNVIGWWMLVIGSIAMPASWIITLLRSDLSDIYKQMGMDTMQLQSMHVDSPAWVGTIVAQTALLAVLMLYFAWKARPHFTKSAI